jgi:hypothetical protein
MSDPDQMMSVGPLREVLMLYKVTPDMEAQQPEKKAKRVPGQPRPRRKSSIYDSDGNEVLITLMCLKCRKMKPLVQFGLRKMADGAIRNQPWCRPCRSAATSKKRVPLAEVPAPAAAEAAPAQEAPAVPAIAQVPALPPEPTPVESQPAVSWYPA